MASVVYRAQGTGASDGCDGWVLNQCPGAGVTIGIEGPTPISWDIFVFCTCGNWFIYYSIAEAVSCTQRVVSGVIPLTLTSGSPLVFESIDSPAAVCANTPPTDDICGNPVTVNTCPAFYEYSAAGADECENAVTSFDISE